MAYRSKNVGKSIKKASQSKDLVNQALSKAFESLNDFEVREKSTAERKKTLEGIKDINYVYNYLELEDESQRSDYKSLQSSFEKLVSEKMIKDPNLKSKFPTFEEYKKGNFKPSIGDQYYNETSLNLHRAGLDPSLLDLLKKGM